MAQNQAGVPLPPLWSGKLAVTGHPLHVIPMILGWEPVDESMSMEGGDSTQFLLIPVTASALVYEDGWILLDTGFNAKILHDDEERARHFKMQKNYTAIIPLDGSGKNEPLLDQVAKAGLDWKKLAACVLSHTHSDITGGIHLLPKDTPILLQKAEYEWISSLTFEDGLVQFVITTDVVNTNNKIFLLDGETEITQGLQTLDTKGHTPGHQSFKITFAEATVVLAACGADLRRNIEERIPPGLVAFEEHRSWARNSINKLADLEVNAKITGRQLQVWPGHDLNWWVWRNAKALPPQQISSQLYQRDYADVIRQKQIAAARYAAVQDKYGYNADGNANK